MKARADFFILTVLWLVLDRYTKGLVTSTLSLNQTIPVIQDFFHITYIHNRGASFGMLKDQRWLFILLTLVVVAGIVWTVLKEKNLSTPMRLLLGLISGGALGNLVDRLRWGFVVDFIDFRGIWPYIFNVADIGVVAGGILFALLYIREDQKKETLHDIHKT